VSMKDIVLQMYIHICGTPIWHTTV